MKRSTVSAIAALCLVVSADVTAGRIELVIPSLSATPVTVDSVSFEIQSFDPVSSKMEQKAKMTDVTITAPNTSSSTDILKAELKGTTFSDATLEYLKSPCVACADKAYLTYDLKDARVISFAYLISPPDTDRFVLRFISDTASSSGNDAFDNANPWALVMPLTMPVGAGNGPFDLPITLDANFLDGQSGPNGIDSVFGANLPDTLFDVSANVPVPGSLYLLLLGMGLLARSVRKPLIRGCA
jgi:hypothetical protein